MPGQVALAVSLPLPGVDAREGVAAVGRLAQQGYRACWASEVNGPDAFTQLGAVAVSSDVDLGVAVVPVQTRVPMVLGMTAVTLAELSGGRFTLGIGASSEVIVADWAGQPFDRPLADVRETFQALRPMLAGERASYDGQRLRVDGFKPYATPAAPVPLYVGALNPRSLRLVGELGADGLCLNQMAPGHVPEMLALVREGAGGALPDDFGVVARLFLHVTDDVPAARALARRTFAAYIATSVYNRFYRWMGYEDEARAVVDAAGDRDAMTAAVSDRLVDDLILLGDADTIAGRVDDYVAAGVTVPVLAPMWTGPGEAEAMLAAVARSWHA